MVVPTGLRSNFAKMGVKKGTNDTYQIFGNKGEVKDGTHVDQETADPAKTFSIIGYDMFRKDPVGCMQATGADTLIMDEVHKIKSPTSVNYRSAMLFGEAEVVTDAAAKERHLEAFMERLFPGRWAELRPMTAKEVKATSVLSMPIAEGAVKVRSGGPKDDEADYGHPVWAGLLPLSTAVGAPEDDGRLAPGVGLPDYLRRLSLG